MGSISWNWWKCFIIICIHCTNNLLIHHAFCWARFRPIRLLESFSRRVYRSAFLRSWFICIYRMRRISMKCTGLFESYSSDFYGFMDRAKFALSEFCCFCVEKLIPYIHQEPGQVMHIWKVLLEVVSLLLV